MIQARLRTRTRVAATLTLACGLGLVSAPLARAQEWRRLDAGIEFRTLSAADSPSPFQVNALRLDTGRFRFRAFDVYGRLSPLPTGSHVYSLNELVSAFRPVAAINGGYTASYSLPSPVGLLVDAGRTVVALSRRDSFVTAVFCVRSLAGARPSIISRDDYHGQCGHAIQSGPLIVRAARPNVPGTSYTLSAAARSFACIDGSGRVLIGQTTRATLVGLGRLLAAPESQGGLGCVDAINFSGSTESAMYVRHGDLRFNGVNTPIASALLIFSR